MNGKWRPTAEPTPHPEWLVVRFCSGYLHYCEQGLSNQTICAEHRAAAIHIRFWIDSHPTWRSPATVRNVILIVLAAFNLAEEMHNVRNPLVGLKKPEAQPGLRDVKERGRAKKAPPLASLTVAHQ